MQTLTERDTAEHIPNLHLVDSTVPTEVRQESAELSPTADLARMIVDAAEAGDPKLLELFRSIKYDLVGEPTPTARLNRLYPPGVERHLHDDRTRVYGVECATQIDVDTGKMLILRKDNMVPSRDITDWLVIEVDMKTGQRVERSVVGSKVAPTESGDQVTLSLAAEGGREAANRGFTYLEVIMSPSYHAVGPVTTWRKKYYGHGYGDKSEEFPEGSYTEDVSGLYDALEADLTRHGYNAMEILDGPSAPDLTRELGRSAVEGSMLLSQAV